MVPAARYPKPLPKPSWRDFKRTTSAVDLSLPGFTFPAFLAALPGPFLDHNGIVRTYARLQRTTGAFDLSLPRSAFPAFLAVLPGPFFDHYGIIRIYTSAILALSGTYRSRRPTHYVYFERRKGYKRTD